jgi:hypothetical protein
LQNSNVLSASDVCLLQPLSNARANIINRLHSAAKQFVQRRFWRILPMGFGAILVMPFFWAIPPGSMTPIDLANFDPLQSP